MYMSVELAWAVSGDSRFPTLPMTTRSPRLGERVQRRWVPPRHLLTRRRRAQLDGQLVDGSRRRRRCPLADEGPRADAVPTIEVACGSIGGMSGGALLDETGFLLGTTSRGLTSEDGLGPTLAAWVVGALNRELEIPWPPGLYPQPVHLLDIDKRLLSSRAEIT
jgi:hypothetical protein